MLAAKAKRLRAMDCDVLGEPFTEHSLLRKVQFILASGALSGRGA
jgi:hypothetical protein